MYRAYRLKALAYRQNRPSVWHSPFCFRPGRLICSARHHAPGTGHHSFICQLSDNNNNNSNNNSELYFRTQPPNLCSHRRCERDFILIPTHFNAIRAFARHCQLTCRTYDHATFGDFFLFLTPGIFTIYLGYKNSNNNNITPFTITNSAWATKIMECRGKLQ